MIESSGTLFDLSYECNVLTSPEMTLYRDPDTTFEGLPAANTLQSLLTCYQVPVERIHADEEELLQVIEPNSQEAIVSCLSLQWINDLPGEFLTM